MCFVFHGALPLQKKNERKKKKLLQIEHLIKFQFNQWHRNHTIVNVDVVSSVAIFDGIGLVS